MLLSRWLAEPDLLEQSVLEDVEGIRAGLEAVAARLASACRSRGVRGWEPVVLSKTVLGLHGRCEGAALCALGHHEDAPPSWSLLRGRALDRCVAHQVLLGDLEDPVADHLAMLRAAGEPEEADLLSSALDPDRRQELVGLAEAAAVFRHCRPFAPRVEVTVGAELAGGAVRLPGRVDVLLGGPGTSLPALVIEVKSAGSGHTYAHAEELRHYALLCALRHGRPPAGLAIWYADTTTVPLLVDGAATAAQRRVLDVMHALAEVSEGRAAMLRPGAHCRWCPHAPRCPAAAGGAAPVDRRDDEEELWWTAGEDRG